MKEQLRDLGLLWLRVLFGLGMAYHGYGKVFAGQITMLTEGVTKMGFPMPHVFAWMAALAEFAGGICLALGLGTRIAAFFILVNMSVAAFIAHKADPFQVKELALAYWAAAGALVMTGGGVFGVDGIFNKKTK